MIWPALFLTAVWIFNYIETWHNLFWPWLSFLFLPFLAISFLGIFLLTVILFAKLYLVFINLIYKPKEGVYQMSVRDRGYLFYCLRKTIKEFILQLYDFFPLPWSKVFALNVFDVVIPPSAGILDSYIDSDFVEFGEESILGEGAIILSSIIINGNLLIKKTVIGERVTIGAYSVVAPGTIIEKGTILGMGSYTKINQHLEEGWIYVGRPAEKLKRIDAD
jgi:acetyltransferase-like isoleucine patch superfamily enzyme